MTKETTGAFQLTSFDEETYEEIDGGAKLTRARIGQDFTGDLGGHGVAECLMHYREDGTATIVSMQRITGRVGDRSGSFVIQSTGTYDGQQMRSAGSVIPGSGTGDLRGLRGQFTSHAPHGPNGSYTLGYDFA